MAYVQYEIEIKKNGSGYNDPTAYEALKHITKMEEKTMEFYRGDIVEIETKNGNLKEAVIEKERKDAYLLKKELAQVQTERTVYKDLYTDILDRVMKGE